jgi:methionine-S-sulfoxide reductase
MLNKLIKKNIMIFIIISSIFVTIFLLFTNYYIVDPDLKYLSLILLVLAIIVLCMLMIGFGYYSYFMNKGDDEEMSEEMLNEIVVAGGCFWGVQEYYTRLKGVVETKVGYAQGTTVNPTYEEVCEGSSGFTEVVYIKYNPETISLIKICDHLFRIIDPLSVNKQGGDAGINYRTGIYYDNEVDRKVIDKYIAKQQKKYYSSIAVEVKNLENFYDAEDYHQEYLKKNINGYCHVNFSKIKDTEIKPEYL